MQGYLRKRARIRDNHQVAFDIVAREAERLAQIAVRLGDVSRALLQTAISCRLRLLPVSFGCYTPA